jgi:ribosomal protein S27E
MASFNVLCKECGKILPTPYFTAYESEIEIKAQMKQSKPIEITCTDCGHIAIYGPDDLGLSLGTE